MFAGREPLLFSYGVSTFAAAETSSLISPALANLPREGRVEEYFNEGGNGGGTMFSTGKERN